MSQSENFKHLLLGLIVVALLIGAKTYAEKKPFGKWFIARGYETLHSFLSHYDPNEDLAVMALDISNLPPAPDGTTSAKGLQTIVEALIESGAKAIAITVDFSPRIDPLNPQWTDARSADDEEFFKFLKKQSVPVFVGVHNIGADSKTWLGTEENRDLAADLTLFREGSDSTEVNAWLQCPGSQRLRSISRALADAYLNHPKPPDRLSSVLTDYDAAEHQMTVPLTSKAQGKVTCQTAVTLVNYGKLELLQKLTLQTLDKESILRARDTNGQLRFQNKLVVIGVGQRDKAAGVQVIGRDGPNDAVPHMFIHAIAAYTLVADPVYRFKHWFTILLDLILGAFVVIGVFLVRWRGTHDHAAAEFWFILISMALVIGLGFVMVKAYNVLWLDFILVLLALFLHSSVQRRLGRLFGLGAQSETKAH